MVQDKVAILIKKASLEFDKIANAVLAENNLTGPQYKVLKFILNEEDKGVRITDLEEWFSITHPTAIGIVKNLEKKGLIRYEENASDHRSRYIKPSTSAESMKAELNRIGDELEKQLTSRITEEERTELVRILRKLLDISD